MKGVFTTICAAVLLGSAVARIFPNDLYYHHHPDKALEDDDHSDHGIHLHNKSLQRKKNSI